MHAAIEALSSTSVLDLDGNIVATPSLWANRTTAIVWLRHFG